MHEEYLTFAKELSLIAGKILKDSFGKLDPKQIELKGPHDLVTSIDKKVERLYAKAIKKSYPDTGIIGEEGTSVNTDKEYVWVIDPLDGTTNYSIENPFFCTTICLLKNREPVIAVIYEPITDNLYYAEKSKGAFKNGRRIHVSKQGDIKKAMLLYCHAVDEASMEQAEHYAVKLKLASRDASRLRAAGCEMALVAKGVCEAYLMNKLPLWDLAAGALIVREAGGWATDFNGNDWKPGDGNIIVSNGTKIHDEVLKIVNKSLS